MGSEELGSEEILNRFVDAYQRLPEDLPSVIALKGVYNHAVDYLFRVHTLWEEFYQTHNIEVSYEGGKRRLTGSIEGYAWTYEAEGNAWTMSILGNAFISQTGGLEYGEDFLRVVDGLTGVVSDRRLFDLLWSAVHTAPIPSLVDGPTYSKLREKAQSLSTSKDWYEAFGESV